MLNTYTSKFDVLIEHKNACKHFFKRIVILTKFIVNFFYSSTISTPEGGFKEWSQIKCTIKL